MNDELIAELNQIAPVKRDEPLSRHVTFGVGGPADLFLSVKDEEGLREAFVTGKRHDVPVCIFGAGQVGCYLGARLASAGTAVRLIGRARGLDELRRHGMPVVCDQNSH